MGHYFSTTYPGEPFILFSRQHLIMLVLTAFIAVLLYLFRRPLQNRSEKSKRRLRLSLASILLLSEISLYIWYAKTGVWDIAGSLPFHLCTITLWLSIFMLVRRSYSLYEIAYFTGLAGAGQALLTPELFYPFPHYRFFHFFIAHMAIILSCLYMTWVEGFRPTLKSVGKTMVFLNASLIIVIPINALTGGNYMFMARKPENPSLIDFLGPYPWYILSLEFVALFFLLLFYLPFHKKG